MENIPFFFKPLRRWGSPRSGTWGHWRGISVKDRADSTSAAVFSTIVSVDFAVVSVAVILILKNNVIADSRVIFGELAPFPFRSVKAEAALKGKQTKEAIAASSRVATEGAEALSGNGYKITAAKGFLEKALASLI